MPYNRNKARLGWGCHAVLGLSRRIVRIIFIQITHLYTDNTSHTMVTSPYMVTCDYSSASLKLAEVTLVRAVANAEEKRQLYLVDISIDQELPDQ